MYYERLLALKAGTAHVRFGQRTPLQYVKKREFASLNWELLNGCILLYRRRSTDSAMTNFSTDSRDGCPYVSIFEYRPMGRSTGRAGIDKRRILKALNLEDHVIICAFAIERSRGVFSLATGLPQQFMCDRSRWGC